MSVIDELLENNKAYAATFGGPLPLPPSRKLAVVACMDSRIDVFGVLGLRVGEAHVIRNAGGVVTDSEIRSLAISQWMMGTREVVLVHHTECGMLTFTDEEFKERLHAEVGVKPNRIERSKLTPSPSAPRPRGGAATSALSVRAAEGLLNATHL